MGPTITGLTATVMPNKAVLLRGVVIDPVPASVQINFTGAVTGSATADADGLFMVQTTGNYLGTVSATATDGQGLTSPTVQGTLITPAPTISMSISYGANKAVTLTGTVTDIDAGGQAVTFTGVATGSATTTATGSFSLTVTATGLGNITATVTDLWSQTGTAQIAVAPSAPTITDFSAAAGLNNWWTFTGKVSGPAVAGETVTLAGLPELASVQVTVKADGSFSYMAQLEAGDWGTATAQAIDWYGQVSNKAAYVIS
jgi:hypothetical protein